jgi:hypothetical protein
MALPRGGLPYPRGERCPRAAHAPALGSRRLCAVTARAVSRLPPRSLPGPRLEPGCDDVPPRSTRSKRFPHVRLPRTHLTGFSRLFRLAHHPSHCAGAASGALDPGPAARVRGAFPHLWCRKAASVGHHGLLSAPSWRTVIGIADIQEVCQSPAFPLTSIQPCDLRIAFHIPVSFMQGDVG